MAKHKHTFVNGHCTYKHCNEVQLRHVLFSREYRALQKVAFYMLIGVILASTVLLWWGAK